MSDMEGRPVASAERIDNLRSLITHKFLHENLSQGYLFFQFPLFLPGLPSRKTEKLARTGRHTR